MRHHWPSMFEHLGACDASVLACAKHFLFHKPHLPTAAGDVLEVRQYERLSPLRPARRALGCLSKVGRGDCVVAFSRREVHAIRRQVEASGKHKCCVVSTWGTWGGAGAGGWRQGGGGCSCGCRAVSPALGIFPASCFGPAGNPFPLFLQVYGALPPEARSQQAVLFNQPRTGYNVLAASDAVGMVSWMAPSPPLPAHLVCCARVKQGSAWRRRHALLSARS